MSLSQIPLYNFFNKEFCSDLEHHLSRTFARSSDKSVRWLWCDGIKMPEENQLFMQRLIKTKQVETEAWIGITGQDMYKMTIILGPCSVANIIDGLSFHDCIPSEKTSDWIQVSITDKEIVLQLN